jgi:hypothetical protein
MDVRSETTPVSWTRRLGHPSRIVDIPGPCRRLKKCEQAPSRYYRSVYTHPSAATCASRSKPSRTSIETCQDRLFFSCDPVGKQEQAAYQVLTHYPACSALVLPKSRVRPRDRICWVSSCTCAVGNGTSTFVQYHLRACCPRHQSRTALK